MNVKRELADTTRHNKTKQNKTKLSLWRAGGEGGERGEIKKNEDGNAPGSFGSLAFCLPKSCLEVPKAARQLAYLFSRRSLLG